MLKNTAIFSFLLLLASSCDAKKASECPKPIDVCPSREAILAIRGYSQPVLAHGYYKQHRYAETWDDAQKTCQQEGAHLAVLNSDDEAKLINGIIGGVGWYHIGAKTDKDGQLVTTGGKSLTDAGFDKFAFGKPDAPEPGKCGRYVLTKDGEYGYAVEPCDYPAYFVCEASSTR